MSNSIVIETFSKIFAILNLTLIVASFILNPIVLYICIKSKKLRTISTFKMLAFSSVNGMLTMIGWSQESFTNAFFSLYPYTRNLWYCRIITIFLQFSSLEFQSWMLVSISLDRLLWMTVRRWRKHYFNGFKPIVYSSFLAIFILAINSNQLFYGGNKVDVNGTTVIVCNESPTDQSIDWYKITSQIFVYFGYIAPLSIMLIINSLIILIANFQAKPKIQQTETSLPSCKRKVQINQMILFMTFLYMAVSVPSIVVTGYLFGHIIALDAGSLILNIINAIQFSYPALNYFILFFSNRKFSHEARKILFGSRANTVKPANVSSRSSFHVSEFTNK